MDERYYKAMNKDAQIDALTIIKNKHKKGRSEEVKRFLDLINYDIEVSAMEEYAQLKVDEILKELEPLKQIRDMLSDELGYPSVKETIEHLVNIYLKSIAHVENNK